VLEKGDDGVEVRFEGPEAKEGGQPLLPESNGRDSKKISQSALAGGGETGKEQ